MAVQPISLEKLDSDYDKLDIILPHVGKPPSDNFSGSLYRCLLQCRLGEAIDGQDEPMRVFVEDIFQHEGNAAYQIANQRVKSEGGFIHKLTVLLPRESHLTHYYMSCTASLETVRHFINVMMGQITCGFEEPKEEWQEWYTLIKTKQMEILELTPAS